MVTPTNPPARNGLTVGVTLFQPKTGLSVWGCGAHQNVFYLAMLLRLAPNVGRVIIINGGDGDPPQPSELPETLRAFQVAKWEEVRDDVDLLIECGAQVTAEAVAHVHARGGKAVTMKFGNNVVIDAERIIHGKAPGAIFNGAQFDAVWTTDQHDPTCGDFWEINYRCPVVILPHVWHPCFLDVMLDELRRQGLQVGYVPGRAKKRIAVCEPNINLVKNCTLPMCIAESAFRARPDLIGKAMVTNAEHLREHLTFKTLAANLDICQAKADDDGLPIMSFEPRFNTAWLLSTHADVLITHGWIDTATYLHYDALAMRFPVVSNITGLPGYFYEGFRAIAGGKALICAMVEHDSPKRLEEYDAECATYLETRLATSPANVNAHARAIEELFA